MYQCVWMFIIYIMLHLPFWYIWWLHFLFQTVITGISHHRYNNEFITCGERVFLWDATMKAPKFSYDWNTGAHGSNASVVCVKFNDIETSLFGKKNGMNTHYTYCRFIGVQGVFVSAIKSYLYIHPTRCTQTYCIVTKHTI